jgi:acetyl esterase/lipase
VRSVQQRLGITVASVEYRLAPEHPYPAALEDCHSALTWLAGLPGVDRGRLAIGGARAGGGLAAALALLARDRGSSGQGVTPAFQLLVYPMPDDRSWTTADNPNYRLWNPRANRFGWTAYLGDADPQVAVPARRDDLSGLPPAWIGVGKNDLFHDEDLAYADRLKPPGCHAKSKWCPAHSTALISGVESASVTAVFRQPVCCFGCDARPGEMIAGHIAKYTSSPPMTVAATMPASNSASAVSGGSVSTQRSPGCPGATDRIWPG